MCLEIIELQEAASGDINITERLFYLDQSAAGQRGAQRGTNMALWGFSETRRCDFRVTLPQTNEFRSIYFVKHKKNDTCLFCLRILNHSVVAGCATISTGARFNQKQECSKAWLRVYAQNSLLSFSFIIRPIPHSGILTAILKKSELICVSQWFTSISLCAIIQGIWFTAHLKIKK